VLSDTIKPNPPWGWRHSRRNRREAGARGATRLDGTVQEPWRHRQPDVIARYQYMRRASAW